jgi:ubiquinone/menaquinone biosynthesis C-methylase UbiE
MLGALARKDEAAGHEDLPQHSWKERFVAWWEGYELPRTANTLTDDEDGEVEVSEVEGEPTIRSWPKERIEIVQMLFGAGFNWPASEEFLDAIIKPLALDEKTSVLNLGAGLGGLARHTTKNVGAWVKGIEVDSGLAATGAELSEIAGLAKRAAIVHGDLTALDARDGATDAVISNSALFFVADKSPVLAEIRRVLKATGRVTVVDYFRGDLAEDSAAFRDWAKAEPRKPHMWSVDEMRQALSEQGFKVSIAEDVSQGYREQVLIAFSTYYELLRGQEVDA